jgi:hypothetical protein
VLALGCTRRPPPPPPTPAPLPPLTEESLPPSGTAEFQIGPLEQRPSADGREMFVEGSVRNTGSRDSRSVRVVVEGLDADGNRIAATEVLPTPQAIAPGTAATFVGRLPNDPAIRTFHVEAVGR